MFSNYALDSRKIDVPKIFREMKSIAKNKNDLPQTIEGVQDMILAITTRKEERVCRELNLRNLAAFLVKWIPTEPLEELQRKADENDPVNDRVNQTKLSF